MTPLGLGASAPASAPPTPQTGTSRERGAPGQEAFARTLTASGPPRSSTGATARVPASDAEDGVRPEWPKSEQDAEDGMDPAGIAPATMSAETTHAAWPPAGLAALFGLPDADAGADDGTAPSDVPDALLDPAAPAPQSPAAISALPAAASAPTSAPALVAPLPPAAVAAEPLSTRLSDAAAALPADLPLQDAEAPPPAFSLPSIPATAPARAPAPLLQTPLPPPDVNGDDFGERFGAQLEWMAAQKIGHARIQVSPHDLGPVEVRLRLEGDRISADFVSAHVETRQALEQGLPRLRDLLGEHGFQLAHAGVGDGAQRGAAHGGSGGSDASAHAISADTDDATPDRTPADGMRTARGLLDAYA